MAAMPAAGPLVACLQLDGRDAPPASRVEAAVAAVGEAAARGAALVVLPELWPVGFFHFDDYAAAAEPLDGPVVGALAAAAARHGCWIHGGSLVERTADGRLHNAGVLLDPAGGVRLTYRKVHLFGHASRETELLAPGDGIAVGPTPFGVLGATTCFDLRFPEQFREMVGAGAQLFVIVAAWPAARLEHWRILLRARAIENQAWVVACNGAGTDAGVALAGHSMVVDPWGEVVAEAGAAETVLMAPLDLARVGEVRSRYPFLPVAGP